MVNLQNLLQRKSFDEICEKKFDSKILFCTGIGVNSKPEIPIRFFAYLLPLLVAVNVFQKSRGQFYIADQAAVRIGYDRKIVCYNTDIIKRAIREFIHTFYPHLTSRIDIACEKTDDDECPFVRKQRKKLIDQLIADLFEIQHPAIIRFARKRSQTGRSEIALRYIAEHTLFMRDPITTMNDCFLLKIQTTFSLKQSL